MSYLVSPFSALNDINRELNRIFEDRPYGLQRAEYASWAPQVDILETEESFRVVVDVPGVKPEDIEISLHKGVLTVKGTRETVNEESGESYSRRERFRGNFVRQFNLPESADEETVSAKSVNGVLEITIPKSKPTSPISITVEGE